MKYLSIWIKFLILIALSGVLQQTSLLNISGVKPNLVLAVLIAATAFLESFWLIALAALLGGIFLRFGSGLDLEPLVVVALVLAAYYAQRFMPWHKLINVVLLTTAATLAFYAIIDWGFLISSFGLILWEVSYNITIGILIYAGIRGLRYNAL